MWIVDLGAKRGFHHVRVLHRGAGARYQIYVGNTPDLSLGSDTKNCTLPLDGHHTQIAEVPCAAEGYRFVKITAVGTPHMLELCHVEVMGGCQACAIGKFKSSAGSHQCVWCTGGKISTGTAGQYCASCNKGKYAAGDKSRCIACPGDSSSPKNSDQLTDCECNAGYTGHAVNVSDLQNPGDDCWDGCNRQQGRCSWCGTGMCCRHNWQNTSNGCSGVLGIPGRGHVCVNADGSLNSTEDGGGFVCAACDAGKYKATVGSTLCLQCPPGKYSEDAAATACTDCALGTYLTSTGSNGSAACTPCSRGKYSNETAAVSEAACLGCPANTYSPDGSGSLTSCICNAGFEGPDGGLCVQCVAGKYKSVTGSNACISCPANADGPMGSDNVTNCSCVKGYTGPDGAVCVACIAGTYKDVNGSVPCSLCSQGKYSAETGKSTCIGCPAHTYSPSGSGSLTNCTCNRGYTGPDGGGCETCGVGTFKDLNGSTACTPCSRGKYSNETAAVSEAACLGCPANTYSPDRSGSLTNCTCLQGYTGSDGVECEACEAGTFKDVNGSSACTVCSEGKYSAATAAISQATCLGCPSYTYSGAGSGQLSNCACLHGYTGSGGENCTACIAGKYKDVNGSAACSLCPAGKYSAETGVSGCSICPDHAHSEAGSLNISNCACNKGYTGSNGTHCKACPQGTYKASVGSAECGSCPQNTFSNTSASVQCTACAYGTYRLHSSLSANNCSVCPNSTINSTLPSGCPM